MKNLRSIIAILLLLCITISTLASCTPPPEESNDFATLVKLDMNSSTAKIEATVNMCIDGDTTHFKVAASKDFPDGILKARYLAINTPESTGKIEEWGNDAANFVKEKLEGAESIYIESDTDEWTIDTYQRTLSWVWYKNEGESEYRNLNIEMLQCGFARGSNVSGNRYGEIAQKALIYARGEKLYIWGEELDPDFPYGDPQPTPLRDIRMNIADYYYNNVYFEGTIVKDDGGTIYVESYDEETGITYGISAYYATAGLSGNGLTAIAVGNKVRLVGVVTYFEGGDVWQLSDLKYNERDESDPDSLEFLGSGYDPEYPLVSAQEFLGNKTITVNGKESTYKYAELALHASISMENLKVTDVYTTKDGNSKDCMTITCTQNGKTITIRTLLLKDDSGNIVKADAFLGKTINVRGIVDNYDGSYQIKLFSMADVTFVG